MRIGLFIGFLFLCFSGFSQEITAQLITQKKVEKVQFIGVDKYGSLYTIQQNKLYKKAAQKTYQFSDIQLGNISSVSILNPLKIVVFYKAVNTVVLLDDKLTEINRINFNTLPHYINVGAATPASANNLWLFNIDTQELVLYNYKQKQMLHHTAPIGGKVRQQQSNFNYCWVLTPDQLKQYNVYGSFIQQLPADSITKIAYYNHYLVVQTGRQLKLFNSSQTRFLPIDLPSIHPKDFYLTHENLYIYDGEILYHFKLNLPN